MLAKQPRKVGAPKRAGFGWRGFSFFILTILFVLFIWYLEFGLIDLVSGFLDGNNRVLSGAYGVVAGIIIPIGLLAQLRSAERKIAGMQQAALAVVALTVAGLIGTDYYSAKTAYCDCGAFYALVAPIGLLIAILVALHPMRSRLFMIEGNHSRALIGLAVIAGLPFLAYALQMAANQRANLPPFNAGRNGYGGWSGASAMAICVALVALLASMRTKGWRIPAWSAGISAVIWGLLSMQSTRLPGSGGQFWGILSVAWGIVFTVTAEWEARRHSIIAPAHFRRNSQKPSGD